MRVAYFARSRSSVSPMQLYFKPKPDFVFLLEFFEHENIIRLIDILKPPHETDYKDIYIVTEKMEADLNKLIVSK